MLRPFIYKTALADRSGHRRSGFCNLVLPACSVEGAKISRAGRRFGHAIGNFQARVLLTVLYSVVILPFGLAVRFFSDSLHMKKRPEKWFDHPAIPNTLEEARRQG
jgi:hypothetical protein